MTILLSLLGWLQYKLWLSPDGMTQYGQLRKEIVILNEENVQLQQRNAQVAAEVQDLKNGVESIEERARRDLGLIKADEVYYQIIE